MPWIAQLTRRCHRSVAQYTEAINFDPNNAVLYGNRAEAALRLKDYKSIYLSISRSLRLVV